MFAAACFAAALWSVRELRRIDADRAAGRRTLGTALGRTGMRLVYSVPVVLAYVALPLAWALEAVPLGGLLPYVTAPFAMRLGDTVSHQVGSPLDEAQRGTLLLGLAFVVLLLIGGALPDL